MVLIQLAFGERIFFSNDSKISWYISLGRSYNSLPEWYGGGAVPPMIAFSGKYG